jgi:hypothetical protein
VYKQVTIRIVHVPRNNVKGTGFNATIYNEEDEIVGIFRDPTVEQLMQDMAKFLEREVYLECAS